MIYEFPTEVDSIQFSLKESAEITFIILKYKEKLITNLDKDSEHCTKYPNYDSFIKCCKDRIWTRLLESKINCTIAGMKEIIPQKLILQECGDEYSARQSYSLVEDVLEEFTSNMVEEGCPLPCSKTIFSTKKRFFHKNTISGTNLFKNHNNSVVVEILPKNGVAEESEETLIYDFGNFVAAAGGNLGLLLGFSCLSAFLSFHNFIKESLTH